MPNTTNFLLLKLLGLDGDLAVLLYAGIEVLTLRKKYIFGGI